MTTALTSARARPAAPNPGLLVVAAAATLSVSALFVKLSGVTTSTAAFYRCALALPVLAPLAWREIRALGARSARWVGLDLLAGAFLGADLVLWGESIATVGAGIATVVNNVQVLVLPLLAFAITRERVSGAFLVMTPVLLAGVALTGGIADSRAFGSAPGYGALLGAASGVAYAGYLFLLRLGGGRHRATPVCLATASAAVTALVVGGPWRGVDFAVGWPAFGWLLGLALSAQVVAWLLLGAALPRLPSSVGATLLLLQPVLAVLLGIALLGEQPSPWQLLGCVLVVTVVWSTSRGGPDRGRGSDVDTDDVASNRPGAGLPRNGAALPVAREHRTGRSC